MLQVTRDNFRATLPRLQDLLTQGCARFCSFDLEFTGLSMGGSRESQLDSMQDRYMRARDAARNFLVTQFGISIFCWEEEGYKAHTYSFHTFPQPFADAQYDRRFACQVISLLCSPALPSLTSPQPLCSHAATWPAFCS